MANFLYKGYSIADLVANGGPQNVTASRYLDNGAQLSSFYNSFHSDTANNNDLKFRIGEYLVSGSQLYPTNTCATIAVSEYAPNTYEGNGPLTSTPSSANWANTTIYTNPTEVISSISVLNNPTYGTPNRAYCIVVSGGGGGGGGGRDRGAQSGTAGQGGGGGSGSTRGVMLYLAQNPTNPATNTISYRVGGGGKGGLGGTYYSDNPTSNLSGESVDGQKGGSGGQSYVNYNGVTYTSNGGIGGNGGQGGDDGSRGNGGAGGSNPTPSPTNPIDYLVGGNNGANGSSVNVGARASGGVMSSFPKQSADAGAYTLGGIGNTLGPGGYGGRSDRWDDRGEPGENGDRGWVGIFFYYD
jgi:hypothetical protein